jgi:phage tail-like protein
MAQTSDRPLPGGRFHIEFGSLKGIFTECSGLSSEVEVVEHKASGEKGDPVLHKVPGRAVWGNITLKRGVSKSKDFWQWHKEVLDKKTSMRRNGTIALIDSDSGSNSPVLTWKVTDAWPCKVNAPTLSAGDNSVAVEELVLVHEGIELQ